MKKEGEGWRWGIGTRGGRGAEMRGEESWVAFAREVEKEGGVEGEESVRVIVMAKGRTDEKEEEEEENKSSVIVRMRHSN